MRAQNQEGKTFCEIFHKVIRDGRKTKGCQLITVTLGIENKSSCRCFREPSAHLEKKRLLWWIHFCKQLLTGQHWLRPSNELFLLEKVH
jgi:hypothetical protein